MTFPTWKGASSLPIDASVAGEQQYAISGIHGRQKACGGTANPRARLEALTAGTRCNIGDLGAQSDAGNRQNMHAHASFSSIGGLCIRDGAGIVLGSTLSRR